jgi:acyl-CoA synthetase (AMP-forming)/AMP-acid ligase II
MGLWDEILGPANGSQSWWAWNGQEYEHETYAEMYARARHVAAALAARGVRPGSVVAALITNSAASIAGYLGAWWAGATVASLPIIARGQALPDYVALLRRLNRSLGAECMLIEDRFAGFLTDAGLGEEPQLLRYEQLVDHPAKADIAPPGEDEVMFIQFSSGTTTEPRGVQLTGKAIEAQVRLLADRVSIGRDEVGLMWLPLSHDMGFFGGDLLARYTGMQGILSTPERFLSQPWTWFDECARFGVTLTMGPSFAYALAARAAHDRPLPSPLRLRQCITGGELVSMTHLTSCASAFARYGLTLAPFTPAYGLAEATLAVAMEDLGTEPKSVSVSSEGLAHGEIKIADDEAQGARQLVSCGTLMPGFTVSSEGDAAVGELRVSGPSLAVGYHGKPELTATRFAGGAFTTGDLGFILGDELFVVGRTDDRLIVGGRNIDVADLEQEIADDPRVRSGNCVVVDLHAEGEQHIVLVAEATPGTDGPDLLRAARTIAARRHGLRIDDVVVLGRNEFPKTPSGKAQRDRCRELAAAGRR